MKNDIKKLVTITAVVSFVLGWVFVGIGFFTPPRGEVSDSALWILGQALLYCASALGISGYVHSEISTMRARLDSAPVMAKTLADNGEY